MRIMHLLTSGNVGGIEVLCKDIAINSKFDNEFCFLFGEGLIYEQMLNKKLCVHSYSKYRKLSMRRFKEVLKIAKSNDVVIVHHDDPFLEIYYLLLMRLMSQKKYISMVHHCYEPEIDMRNYGIIKRSIKKIIIKKMFSRSNEIVFVSNAGYESYLADFHISHSKVKIIYNGIGKEKVQKGKNCYKEINNKLNILYSGRLVSLKGVDTLIEAFSGIDKTYDVVLHIVGDGPEKANIIEQVKKLDLEDKIVIHGFKTDVTPFLESADIFVYPSKTEIFGISLVEAMAFRCICVANNVGGIPEIIKDNINGLLNKSNTVTELKDRIEKAISICKDPLLRNTMMENARNTSEKFVIENTISDIESACEELAE